MDYFINVITTFLSHECVSCVAVYRVRKLSDFLKNILICVTKKNKDLTGSELHEGE